MKKALIIGITGNFGSQMALAMQKKGWSINALLRDPAKAPDWLPSQQVFSGSADCKQDIETAADGCDVIVYAASPAYHRWRQESLQMLEPVAQVAEENGQRILLPGNVYNYAPGEELIDELQPQTPPTDKGEIRQKMEQRLKRASENGATVTIVRAGDFLGPNRHMGWLDSILKNRGGRYVLSIPHDEKHIHFWSYLPDVCENAVSIIDKSSGSFETYHDAGLRLTKRDWESAFAANGLNLAIRSLPWPLFKLIGIFNPVVREIVKMRYLWQQPVLLDGRKMQSHLGPELRSTKLNQIIAELIKTDETAPGNQKASLA